MKTKKIKLSFKIKKPILALGSQTKNTICFAKNNFAYLTEVHSDLNNPKDILSFEKEVKYFLKKHPKIIAHDLHPEYQSTKYAFNLPPNTYHLTAIQHHHAHIASCLVENELRNEKVIGIAFDGTGLGSDNTLWGAEFLVCDYKGFTRKAHLAQIPLIGGERAILEPWRLSATWLYRIYKEKMLSLGIEFIKKINKDKWKVLQEADSKNINSPQASSLGRLFDAAASLIFAKYKVNFEAELAIELEKLALSYKHRAMSYRFGILKKNAGYIIDPQPVFKGIAMDLKNREPKAKIACRFHLTVAKMIAKMSVILRKDTGIKKVVLSGGVFQNNLLLTLALDLLYKEGFSVILHKKLSCNDSCLSLGQAVVANFIGE